MKIRRATTRDVKAIAALSRNEFAKEPYNLESTLEEAITSIKSEMKKGETFVIEEKGQILGYISFSKESLGKLYIFIDNLVVDSSFQRKGIGKKLVRFVEESHKEATITLSTNKKSNAYAFYTSLGYTENTTYVNMSKTLL